jgi:hypothetical protein
MEINCSHADQHWKTTQAIGSPYFCWLSIEIWGCTLVTNHISHRTTQFAQTLLEFQLPSRMEGIISRSVSASYREYSKVGADEKPLID